MKIKAKSFEILDSKTLDHLSILSETFETTLILDFHKKQDLEIRCYASRRTLDLPYSG